MYAKTDSRDSERPEKARRNDFRLGWQLTQDTNEKDREIHKAALEKLKAAK